MQNIIGIYFEDDEVLVGSLVVERTSISIPPLNNETFSFQSVDTRNWTDETPLSDIIRDAVEEGLQLRPSNYLSDDGPNIIAVATPGPMRNCGWPKIDSRDYGLTNAHYMRRASLRNRDVYAATQSALDMLNIADQFNEPIIHHDAAAYAFGSYTIRRPANGSEQEAFDNWPHAHVIANEGIGGAIINNRRLVQGRMHSELGHIHVKRHRDDKDKHYFHCKAHEWQDCLESMVGKAGLISRFTKDEVERISDWEEGDRRLYLIASYFAQLCHTLTLIISPRHIVFSGFLFSNNYLIEYIKEFTRSISRRTSVDESYPGYIEQSFDDFIESCDIPEAGPFGTCLLASPQYTNRESLTSMQGQQQ